MIILGLTGGIGSGKSTASAHFMDHYPTTFGLVDCDKISRNIYKPNSRAFRQIVDIFGNQIVDDSGNIDRKLLGQIVFADKAKLKQLTGITGPAIFLQIIRELLYHFVVGTAIVIFDAPTLYEVSMMCLLKQNLFLDKTFGVAMQAHFGNRSR